MAKVKIRFTKNYDTFDEGDISFVKDEVVSLEEASANRYVRREVAEVVPASTKLYKPERQVEIPVDDAPKLDEKSQSLVDRFTAWIASLVSGSTKPEDLNEEFKELLSEEELSAIRAKAEENAKVITDKAGTDAKGIIDKAEEDAGKITQKAADDAKGIIEKAEADAVEIVKKANEEAATEAKK